MEKQPHSLLLFGLTLHGATWDHTHSHLNPQVEGVADKNSYCAVITFQFEEESSTQPPGKTTQPPAGKTTVPLLSTPVPAPSTPSTPVPACAQTSTPDNNPVHNCPVLMCNRNLGSRAGPDDDFSFPIAGSALFRIPLPLSAKWTGPKEVYLSCDSELHDAYMYM